MRREQQRQLRRRSTSTSSCRCRCRCESDNDEDDFVHSDFSDSADSAEEESQTSPRPMNKKEKKSVRLIAGHALRTFDDGLTAQEAKEARVMANLDELIERNNEREDVVASYVKLMRSYHTYKLKSQVFVELYDFHERQCPGRMERPETWHGGVVQRPSVRRLEGKSYEHEYRNAARSEERSSLQASTVRRAILAVAMVKWNKVYGR
jgi:hypothetical protein